jgi:hypothetical protein
LSICETSNDCILSKYAVIWNLFCFNKGQDLPVSSAAHHSVQATRLHLLNSWVAGAAEALLHVLSKKRQYALPRVLRGLGVIVGPLVVEERVPRAWIDFDVVRDVIAV